MVKMKLVDQITTWATVVGGINWGLVGLANFDLVQWLGTTVQQTWLPKIVYILIGLCAAYVAYRGLNKFK